VNELARSLPAVEIVDSPETFAERVEEMRRVFRTQAFPVVAAFDEPLARVVARMAEASASFPPEEPS
jgi:hypothetical protein